MFMLVSALLDITALRISRGPGKCDIMDSNPAHGTAGTALFSTLEDCLFYAHSLCTTPLLPDPSPKRSSISRWRCSKNCCSYSVETRIIKRVAGLVIMWDILWKEVKTFFRNHIKLSGSDKYTNQHTTADDLIYVAPEFKSQPSVETLIKSE